jgi:hypothetical protein
MNLGIVNYWQKVLSQDILAIQKTLDVVCSGRQ